MIEIVQRTLENHLRVLIDENQFHWDECIRLFLMAYESAFHKSTGLRQLRLPVDTLVGRSEDIPDDYLLILENHLEKIHHLARRKLKTSIDRMKA